MNKTGIFIVASVIILGSALLVINDRIFQGNQKQTTRGLVEEWWTTCTDNITLVWNSSKIVNIPNIQMNKTETIVGGYAPSKHIYEMFPECTNIKDPSNYINMTCLLSKCTILIQYNVINGSTREIWKQGQQW